VIPARHVVRALDRRGFAFHTGVPCSHLGGPIAELSEQGRYVPAANEGAALALAAGAAAAGIRAAVFAQNSGFGNLVNPLTSLVMPYRLPVLVFMSLRGWPDPDGDEPQHRVMGATVHSLLDTLGVRHWTLDGAGDLEEALDAALGELTEERAAFVLVAKGAIGASDAAETRDAGRNGNAFPKRSEVISSVVERLPDALVVSTTGYVSRELFAVADSERVFYMQGSMGHASAFGLGAALAVGGRRRVVVLDGDGAALMHLGTMSTIGATLPSNLVHVILDNGSYESTGGQSTTSPTTSFAGIGHAAGYRTAVACESVAEMADAVDEAARAAGPHLIVVATAQGEGAAPPRATSVISAPEIHSRFVTAAAAGS
jgi:phosphonopyruvate decarboxylase